MPAIHFDKLERCWRLEDDAGAVLGYYDTEAKALAALEPGAQEMTESAYVDRHGTCVVATGDNFEIRLLGEVIGTAATKTQSEAILAEAQQATMYQGKRINSGYWFHVETPLVTLPSRATISGTRDVDGAPHLTKLTTADGYFLCGEDGVISGEWRGEDLEFSTAQFHALRALFMSELIPTLVTTAQQWIGRTSLAKSLPVLLPPSAVPAITMERYYDNDGVSSGWDFRAGAVEVHISDSLGAYAAPRLYINETLDVDVSAADLENALPAINALLADPRVQAARRHWQEAHAAFEAGAAPVGMVPVAALQVAFEASSAACKAAVPAVRLAREQYIATHPTDSNSLPFLEVTCGNSNLILDNPDRLPSGNHLENATSHLCLLIDGHELEVDGPVLTDLRQLLASPYTAQLVAIHEGAPMPSEIASLPTIPVMPED